MTGGPHNFGPIDYRSPRTPDVPFRPPVIYTRRARMRPREAVVVLTTAVLFVLAIVLAGIVLDFLIRHRVITP